MAFSALADRVAEVRERIAQAVQRGGHGQEVRLVAITKTHGPDAVIASWEAGIRDVGENKVQEALDKKRSLQGGGTSLSWHLVGHLQRNKVKFLGEFDWFHALDSARLADAVHEFGTQRGKPVDVLMQVNVAGEETKGGFSPSEVRAEADRLARLTGVRVRGVMTMAPFDAPESDLRRVFGGARRALGVLRAAGLSSAGELSMGMSGDYEVAVEEGATMVRLGTVLFGARA